MLPLARNRPRLPTTCPTRPSHLEILQKGDRSPPVIVVGLPEPLAALTPPRPQPPPLWWLRLDGLYGPPDAIRPIPEIAAAFALDIQGANPPGPITLVGYSFGGLIALDLAHRLRRDGRPARVLLLEPSLPGILPTRAKPRHRALLAARDLSKTIPGERPIQSFHDALAVYDAGGLAEIRRRLALKWERTVTRAVRERFLRPRLDARVSRGLPLRPRQRDWWYFEPQVRDRTLDHAIPPDPGSIHLAGGPTWFARFGPTWEILTAPHPMTPHELPLSQTHHDLHETSVAAPWVALIDRWAQKSA